MEKLFTLIPNHETNQLSIEVDGQKTILETFIVIQSWDKTNQSWYWKVNKEDPKSDPRISNAKFLVSTELYKDGVLEYAGRDVAVGKNGTGIILGSGKPYVRAIDISVAEFMREKKVATLMKEPPKVDRIRSKGTTITFRVFDLDGKEVKPVAGSFMLDPEQVWIVEHRRVQLSNHSEWKGIYVPNGFKFKKDEPAPTPKAAAAPKKAEEVPAAEPGIEHKEEAVMAPNSSEETFTTLGAQVGDQLGAALPKEEVVEEEPAKELEVSAPVQPEQHEAEVQAQTEETPAEPAPVEEAPAEVPCEQQGAVEEQPTPVESAGVALDVPAAQPAVTAQA